MKKINGKEYSIEFPEGSGAAFRRWEKDQNREIEGAGNKEGGEITNRDVNERGHTNMLALGLSKHKYGVPGAKEARHVKYKQTLEINRITKKRKLKDKRKKQQKSWAARLRRLGRGGKKGKKGGQRR